MIANKFKIDPVTVLNAQVDDMAIRIACLNVIADLEAKQNAKNNDKMK